MLKVKTVHLEDNEEYAILDTIVINDVKYIYLGLVSELENDAIKTPIIVIRKYDQKEKYILGLDTEEEYKMALETYVNKWKDLENS